MKTRYTLFALVVVCAILAQPFVGLMPALAAPALRACPPGSAVIQAPASGSAISGTVQVIGSATLGGEMDFFELSVAPMSNEAWWAFVGVARGERRGNLGALDTRKLPDDVYRIRLRVVDHTGNYCEAFATDLSVRNAPGALPQQEPPTPEPLDQATPTPRPTEGPSPTRAATLTRRQAQTATAEATKNTPVVTLPAVIGIPTDTPTPVVSNTPLVLSSSRRTPTPGSLLPNIVDTTEITTKASELASGVSDGLILGIRFMAALLVLVGIIFLLRYWL